MLTAESGAYRVARSALVVLASTSLVAASRYLLDDWLAEHLPYLLFVAAVAASTRWAGWCAGAATILASLFAGSYFFTEPRLSVLINTEDARVELFVFVAVSAAIVFMLETESRLRHMVQLTNERLRIEHTRRLNAEHELEAARRLESIGQLAGGIAHDFNNLLTVVLGSAELLRARFPDDPTVGAIFVAGNQGAELTKQLLRFARREPVQLTQVSINDAVREEAMHLQSLLPPDVKLALDLNSDAWCFNGGRLQAQQILINLVTNARDAMPHGGTISIQTDNVTLDSSFTEQHPEVTPGEYVLLRISDTGVGLSDEARQHLFEPFFTTKRRGQGAGLGLSVVYGIVKQLQGHIYVFSQPGAGTTFEIYWQRAPVPVPVNDNQARRDEALPVAEVTPLRRLKVLLVDDDEAVLRVTAEIIRGLGHEVVPQLGPAAALQTLRDLGAPIDVLVTDVVMPWMNGRELAEQVALTRPGTPTVFISGYTDNVVLSRGIMKPGAILVRKPFSADEIQQALRAATSGARVGASSAGGASTQSA